MFSFEFATANKIIFGVGKLNELREQTCPACASAAGTGEHSRRVEGRAKRLLVVRGKSSDSIPRVREILSAQDIQFNEFQVHVRAARDTRE